LSFVIVHDVQQHVGARATLEDIAARYVYFKDMAFPQLTCVACLAGVHIRYWFAAKGLPVAHVARCKASEKRFTAINTLLEDGQQFDRDRLVNADYVRHVFKWRKHRLGLDIGRE
jgi:hypothetical protein